MTVPDEVMTSIANAVAYSPDKVEQVLQEKSRESTSSDSPNRSADKVQTIYASLDPSKGETIKERQAGKILSPDIRTLEAHLGDHQVVATPDVTYIGRENGKPELVFSDHLEGSVNLRMLQLDASEYPETSKLISQLRSFDTWKRKTLREGYILIGGEQREFFEDLDTSRLTLFGAKQLADALEVSEGTISRILSNRWIEARSYSGERKAMVTKDLLVNSRDIVKYASLPSLNKALEEEFDRGYAFSEIELAQKAPKLARRTLSKYRKESGIPSTSERNEVYGSGEQQAPYKLF